MNYIPCLEQRDQKTTPCPVARPRIGHIRESPRPDRREAVVLSSLDALPKGIHHANQQKSEEGIGEREKIKKIPR